MPLPIYLAFFTGTPLAQAGNVAAYSAYGRQQLHEQQLRQRAREVQSESVHARRAPTPTPASREIPTRQANAINAGLPANFFRANPDALGGANVTGNGGYTKYNAMQVEYVRGCRVACS